MLNNQSKMAEQISAEQLWQFSLQLYPQVKPLCLQFQDELDANINLLLLLCYLERQQLSLTAVELQQLTAELEQFSCKFTQPLRALRRNSHLATLSLTQQQHLKHTLLQAELELEKLEQQLLVQHCPALTRVASPLLDQYLVLLTDNTISYQQPLFDLRQAIIRLA